MKTNKTFNKGHVRPRIIIAPLDWGLGHATRCIPIIKELINLNCDVIIAADAAIFLLLKKEFPSTVFLRLKGYNMKYSRRKRGLFVKLLLQLPHILFTIKNEKKWLDKVINERQIDAAISDNRFGFYSKKIPCIYITHQLLIKTGNSFFEKIGQKIHEYFIEKYTQCWVPDNLQNGLAGILSHPGNIPDHIKYIGPLSRFHSLENVEKKFDILVAISGPEPQRSIFENIILSQITDFKGRTMIVRGLPAATVNIPSPNERVIIINHLPAEEFNKALAQSEMVISRSGYTTIMDLAKLNKKAILIPTPGQTEQEYLAKYLFDKKYFYAADQEKFSLQQVLSASASFDFQKMNFDAEKYKIVINEFVQSLKTSNFAFQ